MMGATLFLSSITKLLHWITSKQNITISKDARTKHRQTNGKKNLSGGFHNFSTIAPAAVRDLGRRQCETSSFAGTEDDCESWVKATTVMVSKDGSDGILHQRSVVVAILMLAPLLTLPEII